MRAVRRTPPPVSSPPPVPPESRTSGWFRAAIALALLALAGLAALNVWLYGERTRYEAETARLRESMTALERARADAIVASEEDKLRVALELLRRQARVEDALHLSVSLDSGAMYLEREGALLREMPVEIGPERQVGTPPDTVRLAAPRGVRTIARILDDTATWTVPAWVYESRGLAPEPNGARATAQAGALGPAAILLDGGTIIYALPERGPLADSAWVMPGAIRARAADLRAIAPNLAPGMRVYFY